MKATVHKYNIGDRELSFTAFSLSSGLADLTSVNKVTGEAWWPCSVLLADYIQFHYFPEMNKHENENDLSILELGCGVGLLSAVASAEKGHTRRRIVCTDGDATVLSIARREHLQNYIPDNDVPVSFKVLKWGNEMEMNSVREEGGGENFDLIVASDIFYAAPEETAIAFVDTVDTLLRRKGDNDKKEKVQPKCIIAFQQRNIDMTILYKAFTKKGFSSSVPQGDEVFEDIFGERSDEKTMFSNLFLVSFTRNII